MATTPCDLQLNQLGNLLNCMDLIPVSGMRFKDTAG